MPIGLKLPFAVSTGSIGYLDFTSDELSAVNENLKSLLITNWGERVMHFSFGCNLIEFLFEQQKDDTLKTRIADRILSQVSKWMSFVMIDDLNIIFSDDDSNLPENSISIIIKYRLSNRPDLSAILNFAVSP